MSTQRLATQRAHIRKNITELFNALASDSLPPTFNPEAKQDNVQVKNENDRIDCNI